MRVIRFSLLTMLSLLPLATSGAQAGRPFKDAWFWGVKAGGMGYSATSANAATATQTYGQAPLAGVEWLMTRTHAGLLASVSQAFLSRQTTVANNSTASDTTSRIVDLKNVRRVDLALLAFPGNHVLFHPYAGIGFSFHSIASAVPQGTYKTSADEAYIVDVIQVGKAAVSPMLVVGGQRRLRMASLFGQVTLTPTNKDWLLYNGSSLNFSYELGLRYNVGSSIER